MERERLLREATNRFVDATAAAYDYLAALSAFWYLALTWLLLGSSKDCRLCLTKAADTGFEALVQSATWAGDPPLQAVKEQAETLRLSFVDRLLLLSSTEEAVWKLRVDGLHYLRQARPLLFGVQRTRRQLGVAANASPFPHVTYADVEYGPEVVVDLAPGVPTTIGALTISVHRALVRKKASQGIHVVDCELEFRLASRAEKHTWKVALLDEYNATFRKVQIGGIYNPLSRRFDAQAASHEALVTAATSLGPLPGRAILKSGKTHTPKGRMSLDGNSSARGWLRLASEGRPVAVEVRGDSEAPGQPNPFTNQPRFVMLAPIAP